MLNISESSLNDEIKLNTYESGSKVYKSLLQNIQQTFSSFLNYWIKFFVLPWTQNINGFEH